MLDPRKRFAVAVATSLAVGAIVMFGSLHLALSRMHVYG